MALRLSRPGPARSIHSVLLLGTIALLLVVLGAVAWISYDASEHEAEELFDARLATSARVLEALVARQIETATIAAPIVITLPRQLESETEDVEATPLGHGYETKIAFQVWRGDGQLAVRSASAPDVPFATTAAPDPSAGPFQFSMRTWKDLVLSTGPLGGEFDVVFPAPGKSPAKALVP